MKFVLILIALIYHCMGTRIDPWKPFNRFDRVLSRVLDIDANVTRGPLLKLNQYPPPPLPSSRDYIEFCEIVDYKATEPICLMWFHELFELNQQGEIVGTTGNCWSREIASAIGPSEAAYIAERISSLLSTELISRYDRLAPWMNMVLSDLRQSGDLTAEEGITIGTYLEDSVQFMLEQRAEGFYYEGRLLIAAIKHNFGETDWRRDILLTEGISKRSYTRSPSKTMLWFWGGLYDFSETFDNSVLEQLKEYLEAYAEDLKESKHE